MYNLSQTVDLELESISFNQLFYTWTNHGISSRRGCFYEPAFRRMTISQNFESRRARPFLLGSIDFAETAV